MSKKHSPYRSKGKCFLGIKTTNHCQKRLSEKDFKQMQSCPHYKSCNAMFCPLDPEIEKRIWYPKLEPEICKYQKVNKRNWIKKQRSILRRKTKSWFKPSRDYPDGRPITFKQLFGASRPRVLTQEQKQKAAERLAAWKEEQEANLAVKFNENKGSDTQIWGCNGTSFFRRYNKM